MSVIIISIAFAFALPIALGLWWNKRHKGNIWPVLAGMLCFLLFAMGLEQILHYFCIILDNPVSRRINASPALYTLYAAFAAGIFEESGRLFGFRLLLGKRGDKSTAVAYGIGHGGIEVIFIFGVTYIVYLIAALGVSLGDAATDDALQMAVKSLTMGNALIAMFERVSAMLLHIGFSMLMFKASRERKKLWLYPVSICLHALADAPAALFQFGVLKSLAFVEIFAFVMGVFCIILGIKLLYKGENLL